MIHKHEPFTIPRREVLGFRDRPHDGQFLLDHGMVVKLEIIPPDNLQGIVCQRLRADRRVNLPRCTTSEIPSNIILVLSDVNWLGVRMSWFRLGTDLIPCAPNHLWLQLMIESPAITNDANVLLFSFCDCNGIQLRLGSWLRGAREESLFT